ncbi:hypothetical protein Tco_1407943 [Tanacetum coccineum]
MEHTTVIEVSDRCRHCRDFKTKDPKVLKKHEEECRQALNLDRKGRPIREYKPKSKGARWRRLDEESVKLSEDRDLTDSEEEDNVEWGPENLRRSRLMWRSLVYKEREDALLREFDARKELELEFKNREDNLLKKKADMKKRICGYV